MNTSLFPADIYQVVNKSMLSENDRLILNLLYMPLLGSIPISLYLTLYSDLEANSYVSNELSHYHLMKCMSLTLDDIKNSRTKLEGIGLLKTHVKEGNINSFIYELYSPISSSEFFNHPVFNVVLYNNIGKEEYERLIEYFKMPNISLKGYKDITASFDYTFKSVSYTPFEMEEVNIISKDKNKLTLESTFDFDILISMMPKNLFNEKALNKSAKELISYLSYLYEIDPLSMSDLVRSSLNERGLIDRDELRKSTRRFYQYEHENRLPSLIFRKEKEYLKSHSVDTTSRSKILRLFENKSPFEFLRAKYKGVKPTERDMKILESLLIDLKLNPSVVNVLIDYTLKTNNNRLNKGYVEAIAGQWKRSRIETAKDAMEIAEKEHKKGYNKKAKKEESLPSWFNKETSSTPLNKDEEEEFKSFLEEFRK